MLETIILPIIIVVITVVFVVYLNGRNRWTFEQAVHLSGCCETDLRELIKERLVGYRRQYVVYGPHTFDRHELAEARNVYPEIKRLRAETDATIRKMAEDAAARINEANRIYQEQERLEQEALARIKRIHEAMLRDLKRTVVPREVIEALQVLGLPSDASFDEVRQQYRLLAKQHHPDAGGNQEQFIKVNAAYTCVVEWIEEHS